MGQTGPGKIFDNNLETLLRNMKSFLNSLLNETTTESGRENIFKAFRELDQYRAAAEACNEREMARAAVKAGMYLNMWLLDDPFYKDDEETFEGKANRIADMIDALARETKRYLDEKCKQRQ
jgi:hypothetical protein